LPDIGLVADRAGTLFNNVMRTTSGDGRNPGHTLAAHQWLGRGGWAAADRLLARIARNTQLFPAAEKRHNRIIDTLGARIMSSG